MLLWSVLAALVESRLSGVVVSQTYQARSMAGGDYLVALAASTPMAAYLLSIYWSLLCAGRPKVAVISLCVVATAALAVVAALAPGSTLGLIWFLIAMAGAQIFLAGVRTLRPSLWRGNYPDHSRGRITAMLQRIQILLGAGAALAASFICDWSDQAFRVILITAAALALVALFPLRRIRLRHEKSHLRRWAAMSAENQAGGATGRPMRLGPLRVMRMMADVLKNDPLFSRYCLAQSLMGLVNLLPAGLVLVLITRDCNLWDRRIFWVSLVVVEVIPRLTQIGTLAHWGALFDRVGVIRFRVINCMFWGLSVLFGLAAHVVLGNGGAAATEAHPKIVIYAVLCLGLRSIVHGMGMGGGAVAWNIGHLQFAHPDQADLYMGIHVSLTGLRGAIAPILGIWLSRYLGWGVWLVCLALTIAATLLFAHIADQPLRGSAATSRIPESLRPTP